MRTLTRWWTSARKRYILTLACCRFGSQETFRANTLKS